MTDKSERLREARKAAGFKFASDAARAMGLSTATYSGHENGARGFDAASAERYAKKFKVDPGWILYGTKGSQPSMVEIGADTTPGADLVPIYNVEASAGGGSMVDDEYQVASLSFPAGYLQRVTRSNPRDLKVISVKGDSMTPTLADDDIVLLDVTKRDLSFDGLFVLRDNGDALLVKRIGRATKGGHVAIISDNRDHYPAVERALNDIEVIGKVIWKGGKV